MNDKGFGFLALLGFLALVGIALFALCMFLSNVLKQTYMAPKGYPDYKNEYTVYMKMHNIELEK